MGNQFPPSEGPTPIGPVGRAGTTFTRIAVFYDGGYFTEVSNYYKFGHPRRSRISLRGLQEFIRHLVAQRERVPVDFCLITEARYFRGRFSAATASARNRLLSDRVFDEVLINEGITPHYLLREERGERPRETGIDVWLALEAYDLAVQRRVDVIALIACDGDFVPLVRKVQGLGVRVLLLAWEFAYEETLEDGTRRLRETRVDSALSRTAIYPIPMHQVIDQGLALRDPRVENLFLFREEPLETLP
ncbi:MAG: NYN domain-containing protein [Dehalococcoidia bacterium]|nr:NYN domain-containing protein [Dehalococcoidia bacterium]MDW8119439.1 NYN domain-containing protein [Chloroflexota bacterium]